jgi:GNAT superfamily N-acetyltransferase
MSTTIRKVRTTDEAQWRPLWDAYTRFYETEPSEPVTRHTWARLTNALSPVHGIVADDDTGRIVGFAHYILHDSTSTLTPVCYLEDLFVIESRRAQGVGRSLVDWLIVERKAKDWSRLYWTTRETNYRARVLYDSYTPHSGFVRYALS